MRKISLVGSGQSFGALHSRPISSDPGSSQSKRLSPGTRSGGGVTSAGMPNVKAVTISVTIQIMDGLFGQPAINVFFYITYRAPDAHEGYGGLFATHFPHSAL